MKIRSLFVVLVVFVFISPGLFSLSVNIRSFDHADFTRIVFEGDRSFKFDFEVDASGKSFDLLIDGKTDVQSGVTRIKNSGLIDRVLHKTGKNRSVYTVVLKSPFKIRENFVLERPFRVVFDLEKSPGQDTGNPSPEEQEQHIDEEQRENDLPPPRPGKETAINTICIDPGHGGSDLGAVGKSKSMEKDITLKVGRKLKRVIETKLGLRVVMTRDKDSEVSLNSRVSIANNQKAQIFVSIHVNSSFRKSARGTETYFVSLKATDQESYELAQKENRAFEGMEEVLENDQLKMILWNMAQAEYIRESSKLAELIQDEFNILMNTRNRGVKQAPFRVLMRAAMPAVLIEIAFISNPREEIQLQDDAFLEKVAHAIYSGISKFIHYHNRVYK